GGGQGDPDGRAQRGGTRGEVSRSRARGAMRPRLEHRARVATPAGNSAFPPRARVPDRRVHAMDEMRSSAVAPAGALDVSTLPPLGELLEALTAQLAAWMPAQRWYAHK